MADDRTSGRKCTLPLRSVRHCEAIIRGLETVSFLPKQTSKFRLYCISSSLSLLRQAEEFNNIRGFACLPMTRTP